MTRRDIEAAIKKDTQGNGLLYWNICDGYCAGTELVWLPLACRWLWHDNDQKRIGQADSLTLILSSENGDESGLNSLGELIGVEFGGGPGLWVLAGDLPEDFELPEDAEVFTLGDPDEGLVDVPLTAAE